MLQLSILLLASKFIFQLFTIHQAKVSRFKNLSLHENTDCSGAKGQAVPLNLNAPDDGQVSQNI
jgi:hypothetical protein